MVAVSGLGELVNWREGLISPAILFDEELYRQEQERVFGRAWLVVGHEDMVRKPGDYVTNYMGEVPVIVVRDVQGKIHVLVNRCAHRGNQVCLFDRGKAGAFTCSYHGWTYGLDGRLVGMPMEQQLYRGELNKEEWGLEEVPRFANFMGLLFASFDPEAPSLEEWLGEDACWWLQHFVLVDHLGGLEWLPGWHRYRTPGNWKQMAENFSGDSYHVPVTHGSWFKVVADFRQSGMLSRTTDSGMSEGERYAASTGYGRGCPFGMQGVEIGDPSYDHDIEIARGLGQEAVEWVEERHCRFLDVLKDKEVKPYSFMNGTIFPNMGLMGFHSALAGRIWILFHPRGPWEFEQWQWTMVEREAPRVVKEMGAQYVYRGQYMAGTIAPDDVENLERMVEAMRAPRQWQRPHNFRLQLGHEDEGPRGLPAHIGPTPSEANQREFYRFWAELMERG